MPANVRDAIIQCESGDRNVEHGGDPGGISTASGYYQFVNKTWRAFGGVEFAPRAIGATKAEQTIVAGRAFAANGLSDWEASRECWGPKIGRRASGREAPIAHSATPRHAKSEGTYTVKPDDTLGKIAAAHGTTWRRLHAANRDVIANPNLIRLGMTIDV